MKKLFTILFIFMVCGVLTSDLFGQIMSNGTGGGDWNTASTWIGGVLPTSTDNVVIQGNDVVTLAAAGSCAQLTMNAGTTLSLNATGLAVPGTSWVLATTSTVIYNGPTTVQAAPVYGNLTYSSSSNGGPNGDLTVNGNLTVTTAVFRAISATSGSRTITIGGNVITSGTSARISAVNSSSATTATCVFNISGYVSLTGNASGNRLQCYESAGPHSGSAIFNIGGNLAIGTSSQVSLNSSSNTTNDYPEGVINLQGNFFQNGGLTIQPITSGSCPGLTINFVGTDNQFWSGSGVLTSRTNFPINFKINNPGGVTLNVPKTMSANMVLSLVNGNLTTTSTNLLTIAGGTLSGGSSNSFINGPLALTAIAGSTLMAPIGKGTAYRPLWSHIYSLTGSGTLTAEQFESAPTGTVNIPGVDKISSVRYFRVDKSAGITGGDADLTLSWGADDNVKDPAHVTVCGQADGGDWIYQSHASFNILSPTEGTVTTGNNPANNGTGNFALGNLTGGSNLLGPVMSNGTGGGDWNTASTWIGGVLPIATDNVIIQGSDVVTLAAAGSCANLTLNAGTTLSLNASGLAVPGTSWNFANTSTVIYNGPTTVQAAPVYGNLVYSTASNGGPNGDLTVNGNLTVTTNTFRGNAAISGSRFITIGGNVTIGPGTSSRIAGVTNTNATTATCVYNIGGYVSLTGNNSGNRLICYESAGPHSGSSTFNIGGNLTIGTSSQVNLNSSTATTSNYPEGIINLQGNFIQNGSIAIQSITSGTCPGLTFNFTGTTNQSWSGTGTIIPRTNFPINFKISNPGGVTLNTPKTMSSNISLSLTNGNLTTTSTNLLTIAGGTLSGGSTNSFIDGPVALTATAGATLMAPIGKGTAYRPLWSHITSLTGSGTLTAEQFESAPTGTVNIPGVDHISNVRYFRVDKSAGITGGDADLTLSWGADDAVTDPAHITVCGQADGGDWIYQSHVSYVVLSPTEGTVTTGNNPANNGTGNFTLGNLTGGTNPLPVNLTSFTAVPSNGAMKLTWKTSVEIDNHGFDVERSFDKSVWASLAFIQGQGNSNVSKEYSYSDNSITKTGKYYYRLKQIDNNGGYKYSDIAEVDYVVPTAYSLNQNYPNPFNPNTIISYSLPVASNVKISVYNAIGETVQILENGFENAGNYTVSFNAVNLPTGIYFYRIEAGQFSQVRKMMLLK